MGRVESRAVSEQGTVEWFSAHKGYGFVQAEDGTPLYVHHSQIAGEGFRSLEAGMRVRFVPGTDDRGPVATEVVPLSDQPG